MARREEERTFLSVHVRLLTAARAERDESGKEDGRLPEARIFPLNCSLDLRISLT